MEPVYQNSDAGHCSLPPLTPPQVRALPPDERKVYLELIHVNFPRLNRIDDRIHKAHERVHRCREAGIKPADPPVLLVVGRSGTGKTTLMLQYMRQRPERVIRALIPSKPTDTSLATEMLRGVGDPLSAKGKTSVTKTNRLYFVVGKRQDELAFADELQHFVDQDSSSLLLTASNWLKNFIKETGIACVLIGTEGEAELIVEENPQLEGLCGKPIVLEPFYWKEVPLSEMAKPAKQRNYDGTKEEFKIFLNMVEGQLPLRKPSYLISEERAQRLFVASSGLLRPLMRLIRGAAEMALDAGLEHLDDEILAVAYDNIIGPEREGMENPFVGDLHEPENLPPVVKKRIKGVNRDATPDKGGQRRSLRAELDDPRG